MTVRAFLDSRRLRQSSSIFYDLLHSPTLSKDVNTSMVFGKPLPRGVVFSGNFSTLSVFEFLHDGEGFFLKERIHTVHNTKLACTHFRIHCMSCICRVCY